MRCSDNYDVIVVGGGSAGTAAAIGAAQTGSKVLLIERNPYLGGEATHSNVNAYCGFYTRGSNPDLVVGGVGTMLRKQVESLGDSMSPVPSVTGNSLIPVNPETIKLAMDQMMTNSGADLLLHCHIIGARTENGKLVAVECFDDEGRFWIGGNSFIDASGESTLANFAGCEVVRGDENGNCQVSTLALRIDRVGPEADLTQPGMAKAIQSGRDAGIPYLGKDKGGLLHRAGKDGDLVVFLIPSFAHNNLSCRVLTEAEIDTRRQAHAYMEAFRRFMPGMENARLIQTGPKIGIREGRRTLGEYIITGEDVFSLKKSPDSVARCGWSPEIHKSTKVYDHYTKLPDNAYFDIPIGALKARDVSNLWCAGRTISTDHTAYGSVRVMGTGFATGHAAGIAAALAKNGCNDTKLVQEELLRQGALI